MSVANKDQTITYYAPYDILPEHTTECRQRLSDSILHERRIHTPILVDQLRRIVDGWLRWQLYLEHRANGHDIELPDIQAVPIQSDEEGRNLRTELNLNRRDMDVPGRDALIQSLLRQSPDMNSSWIGRICGADAKTVLRNRNDLVSRGDIPQLLEYRCADGRKRPATRISARSKRQLVKGCDLIRKLGYNAPPGTVSVTDLVRADREVQRAERAANAKPVTLDDIKLHHCDFRDLAIDPGTVRLILTDPPYALKYESTWKDIPGYALRILGDNGIMATYTPSIHFLRFLRAMRHKSLKHVWPSAIALRSSGQLIKLKGLNILSELRHVQLYVKGRFTRLGFHDLVEGSGSEKDRHDWQQSVGEAMEYLEMLSDPGDLVCDPFLGGGTTAIACYLTGRRFVGCDIDEQAYLLANDGLQKIIGKKENGGDNDTDVDGRTLTTVKRP